MQAAIDASGYLLESQISRVLADRGFFVEPSYFTPDPADGNKAIEIDVVGRYVEYINEENKDTVTASVFVECKNNSQPFAFFVQRKPIPELKPNPVRRVPAFQHGSGYSYSDPTS